MSKTKDAFMEMQEAKQKAFESMVNKHDKFVAEQSLCSECGGSGEFDTMESVYCGSDEYIKAPVGSQLCTLCRGSGVEPDESIILERIWNNLDPEQEYRVQKYFSDGREYYGVPITKDNCEHLFEIWSERLTLEDLIKLI